MYLIGQRLLYNFIIPLHINNYILHESQKSINSSTALVHEFIKGQMPHIIVSDPNTEISGQTI